MNKYSEKAKEYGIKLVWSNKEIKSGGYNIAGTFKGHETGVIFIQNNLSEIETENVFNHELGQLLKGDPITELSAPALHMNSEAKANTYMIHEKAVEWVRSFDGNYDCGLSPEQFLLWAGFDVKTFYYMAEREIRDVVLSL